MSLTACSEISSADWIVSSVLPWSRLVEFGPSGFAAYARLRPPHPAFVWPADYAWRVVSDVDAHWIGIGADTPVVVQLVNDARLDVVPVDPKAEQPRYR